MAAQVPDDVLDLFVARATYDELPDAIAKRYGGIVDTVSIDFAPGTSAATRRATIEAIQKIPSAFKGFHQTTVTMRHRRHGEWSLNRDFGVTSFVARPGDDKDRAMVSLKLEASWGLFFCIVFWPGCWW